MEAPQALRAQVEESRAADLRVRRQAAPWVRASQVQDPVRWAEARWEPVLA